MTKESNIRHAEIKVLSESFEQAWEVNEKLVNPVTGKEDDDEFGQVMVT